MMTVIELIRKYGLEDFKKTYYNHHGELRNFMNLDKLIRMNVKDANINFFTEEATITILEFEEGEDVE